MWKLRNPKYNIAIILLTLSLFLPLSYSIANQTTSLHLSLITIHPTHPENKFIDNEWIIQHFPAQKYSIILYSYHCIPCRKKLNEIPYLMENRQKKAIIINLDPLSEIIVSEEDFSQLKNYPVIFTRPSNTKLFLKKIGNSSGKLPFTFTLNSNFTH